METADEVKLVIANTLELTVEQLRDDIKLQDLYVESIDVGEILFALEEKFDIGWTVQDQLKLEDFTTVGDVCRAIKAIVDAKTSK